MKQIRLTAALAAAIAASGLAACSAPRPARADEYGRHPAYLHALADLRAAQWQVDHRRPEDGAVSADETIVHDELSATIRDVERAAWQDGKAGDWQPPPDARLPREGRLHAAIDLMLKARADIAREEDDPRSRPLQAQILAHLDAALSAARHGVGDARRFDRRE